MARPPIRPTTTDPEAMMRDGYHEPERVFPSPPVSILDGPLEDRAFEILELMVGVYRVSTHELVMNRGVSWANVQRWYNVGGSQEMRHRIYAAIAFLITEGYLTQGPSTGVPVHPKLSSDFCIPTAKAYEAVDLRQRSPLGRAWVWFESHRPLALVLEVVAVGTLALGLLIWLAAVLR